MVSDTSLIGHSWEDNHVLVSLNGAVAPFVVGDMCNRSAAASATGRAGVFQSRNIVLGAQRPRDGEPRKTTIVMVFRQDRAGICASRKVAQSMDKLA